MMSAPAAANVTPFPAPRTPAWKLGLDEVVMYCVGKPGCMELAAAVADPETKRYVLDAKAVETAYSLLKQPAGVGLAALSSLKLPRRSVWVEYDRDRQRRAVQAEANADGTILLRHVARAGPREIGMPAAWGLLNARTPAPKVDHEALVAKNPEAKPDLDREWMAWFSASFRPMRPDDRKLTPTEYRKWADWAIWDLAILYVPSAGTARSHQPSAATRAL